MIHWEKVYLNFTFSNNFFRVKQNDSGFFVIYNRSDNSIHGEITDFYKALDLAQMDEKLDSWDEDFYIRGHIINTSQKEFIVKSNLHNNRQCVEFYTNGLDVNELIGRAYNFGAFLNIINTL